MPEHFGFPKTGDLRSWRVHSDVTTMMVGGVVALLLQMLHPAVLAGVCYHSNFLADMPGHLRQALTVRAAVDLLPK